MGEIIYQEESYRIIGAALNVYNTLGPGFLEAVYQEALHIEFGKQDIPHRTEQKLSISYAEIELKKYYKADFICFGKIIVELKAQKFIASHDTAQTLNYLKASKFKLGIIINFGESSLKYKRIVN